MSERAPFSKPSIIALVAGGFALFVALLFLMGRGEAPLADTQNGGAHAAGNGLTGYAGLTRLLEASGYQIRRSRSPTGLETRGILVLTPPVASDPVVIGDILEQRRNLGPTLVILPKWRATLPPGNLPREAAARFKRGWVVLSGAEAALWPAEVLAPFTITHHITGAANAQSRSRWQGLGLAGSLPTPALGHATGDGTHQVLIADSAGRALALKAGLEPIGPAPASYPVIFLAEPDLANNYGLADPARAAAALALVRALTAEQAPGRVTFDMTLNGFGGAQNLLTLAFRPPFLAATVCLILALAIVFWRALMRFGPAASPVPASAFGKRQLVENGASLILRARRWSLLATAYAAATERRLARSLGLARHDRASLDTALAIRAPGEEPFTPRAARLEAATTPDTILSAARALDTLPRKLT